MILLLWGTGISVSNTLELITYNYILKMRKLGASKPIIWELAAGNLKLANMFSLFSLFHWVTWIGAQVSHLPPSVWRNTDEVSKFHEHEPIPLTTFCVGGPRPYEQLQRTRTHPLPTTRCGALKVLSGPQPVDTSENQDWREPFHSILASWQSGEQWKMARDEEAKVMWALGSVVFVSLMPLNCTCSLV